MNNAQRMALWLVAILVFVLLLFPGGDSLAIVENASSARVAVEILGVVVLTTSVVLALSDKRRRGNDRIGLSESHPAPDEGRQGMEDLQLAVQALVERLREADEEFLAAYAEAQLGEPSALEAFLRSNELWGGSGSIADQAGTAVQEALIGLGQLQMRKGITNARTEMWVEAFREWRSKGHGKG